MVEEKIGLIKEYGVPIEIRDSEHNVVCETVALIGKSSTGNITERSLEYHRISQVTPDTPIKNGQYILNKVTDDVYIPIANMKEVVEGEVCAIISRLVETNSTMSIYTFEEDADDGGNFINGGDLTASNLPTHISRSNLTLARTETGRLPEKLLEVICPLIDVEVLSVVMLEIGEGPTTRFKVETTDYVTQPGVCILQVSVDTRKWKKWPEGRT